MTSWNEFLTDYIKSWRSSFEKMSAEEKKLAFDSHYAKYLFTEPCQIEVIALKKPFHVLWIVDHDENRNDMEFIVHSDVETDFNSFFNQRRKEDPAWFKRFKEIVPRTKIKDPHLGKSSLWSFGKDFFFIFFNYDIRKEDPKILGAAEVSFIRQDSLKAAEREAIGIKTEEIKSEAGKIPDKYLRSSLLKAAEEIENSLSELKRLESHEQKIAALEGEIKGVRKLIGTTKEYQDWKLLVSDVETFKRTPYIKKALFDSEIRRLDQRIDALKEVKFWSKRTIVDVALAVIAAASTIIAALLATGIIQI